MFMPEDDALYKFASTALPPRGYRFAWWKCRHDPALTEPSASRRRALAGGSQNCGVTCEELAKPATPRACRIPTKSSTLLLCSEKLLRGSQTVWGFLGVFPVALAAHRAGIFPP